jgi:hypothetical protein
MLPLTHLLLHLTHRLLPPTHLLLPLTYLLLPLTHLLLPLTHPLLLKSCADSELHSHLCPDKISTKHIEIKTSSDFHFRHADTY